MALNNHVEKFTLDMAPGGIAPVLNVSQGDIGRTFTADMYWAGTSYDVSGLTVRLRGRKRDNTVFDYALSAPSGSEVTFETQEQMTIIPGNVECELVFSDSNSRVVGTANFVFIVEESPYDPNAISESEVTGLVDLISDQIGGAVDDWMETEAPTSPEFAAAIQDATDTYLDENGVVINYDEVVGTPDFEALKNVEIVDLLYNVEWEQGGLDGVTETTSNYYIRTPYINVEGLKTIRVNVNTNYRLHVQAYTDIDVLISENYYNHYKNAYVTAEENIIIRPTIKYIRLIGAPTSAIGDVLRPSASDNFFLWGGYNLYNTVLETKNTADYLSEWANGENVTINAGTWFQGIPAPGSDVLSWNSTRICTNYLDIPKFAKTITLTAPTGYKCAYYLYDDNGTQLANRYWATTYTVAVENATKIIVGLATSSDGTITPAAGDVTISVNYDDVITASELASAIEHKQDVDNITTLSTVDLEWELGTLNPGSGAESASNKRIRSRYILVGKGTTLITSGTSYHLIYTFDFGKNYVSDIAWTRNNITVENDCYIRVLMAKNQDAVITEEEIETLAATETIYRTFPQYLMDREADEAAKIPSYFENEIDTAITTARTNIFDAGIDGDSFVFISDVHWQSNSKNSPALVKKAVDALNLDKIICGGDLIGGGAKSTMIDLLSDCVNAYKDITRFYCLFGNHDSNTIGAPSTADNFTKSEVYALEQKQSDFVMNYGEPCYFYFDNPTTKTRYICLDTGLEGSSLPTAQSDWITATLNSTPDNYHILVFAHIIYMPTNGYHVGITKDEVYRTSFMNTVCDMCDTFNTNNQNKKVEAIFGGHMHFDADFTSTGGIPIVLIDCDARQTFTETTPGSGVANHAAGTINEQCFDIVSIDYANSTIKCTRVGRGSDRTITY